MLHPLGNNPPADAAALIFRNARLVNMGHESRVERAKR
jgi:hypothetical protein